MSNRVRVESPAINDWYGADQALRHFGELQIARERMAGDADLAINKIKARLEERDTPLREEQERLELQLQQFTEARRDDLAGKKAKKTMKLVFGSLGFRASTRIIKLEPDDEIIARLKRAGLKRLVQVKESVTLTDIKGLPEETIKAVGCELEKVEAFWLEPDRAKIEEARR